MAIDPKWLVELAPRFFKPADAHRLSRRKRMERIEPLYDRWVACGRRGEGWDAGGIKGDGGMGGRAKAAQWNSVCNRHGLSALSTRMFCVADLCCQWHEQLHCGSAPQSKDKIMSTLCRPSAALPPPPLPCRTPRVASH